MSEDWQRVADVAQFYLLAARGDLAGLIGHASIDVERCAMKMAEAVENGAEPRPHDELLSEMMRSPDPWPRFPGETDAPLL